MKKQIKTVVMMALVAVTSGFTSCQNYDNPQEGDSRTIDAGDVSFDLVYVAPGEFRMGATTEQEGYDAFAEAPSHVVKFTKGYWIGKTEVTQELWEAVMGSNPSSQKQFENKDDKTLPVMTITWAEAKEFCKKLSEMTGQKFRLPTEAEWEYAARGASKTFALQYSGSKYLDRVACFQATSGGMVHPVGQYMPNELDMRDMNGNVSEWVEDNYAPYKDSVQVDPCVVLADTLSHVARGGNFTSGISKCRTASREEFDADVKTIEVGFRVVMEK